MLVVFLTLFATIVLVIGLHYAALMTVTKLMVKLHGTPSNGVVLTLIFAVFAHLFEIVIFAVAWQVLYTMEYLTFSVESPSFMDLIYFSGTTYTTIGYGDIILTGNGRIIAIIEGVMGLVLIAWTASFIYYEMNRKY